MAASTSNEDMDARLAEASRGNRGQPPPPNAPSPEVKSTLRPGRPKLLELAHIVGGFGEQPIPKGHNLWKSSRGFRADYPIRLGQTQLLGKWAQQSPRN